MELLTAAERAALLLTGELASLFPQIVAKGDQYDFDMGELVVPLHTIQRHIMSNAAARAYPGEMRRLGTGLDPKDCRSAACDDYVPGDTHQRFSGRCKG